MGEVGEVGDQEVATAGGTGAEPCVLITGVGSEAAFSFVRALRARWGHHIVLIGTDLDPPHLVASAQYLDVYAPITTGSRMQRNAALLELVAAHEVELIVPLEDADLAPLAELDDLGGAEVAIADAALARQAVDRLAIADLVTGTAVDRDDLTSPRTTPLERTPWSRHGLVLKHRYLRGGPVQVLTDVRAHEAALAAYAHFPGPDPIVAQTLCTPPEITIDVFRSRDGSQFRAVCRERLAVIGGQCTRARVYDDPELTALTERLIAGLHVTGLITLQVMDGPVGQWQVTDLTFRPSSGTALTVAAGVDLYSQFVADRLHLPADPAWIAPLTTDRFVVRTFTEWVSPGP